MHARLPPQDAGHTQSDAFNVAPSYRRQCHSRSIKTHGTPANSTLFSLRMTQEPPTMSADPYIPTEPLLPTRFTILHGLDASQAILLSVLKPLPSVRIHHLPCEIFMSRKSVFLSSASCSKIGAHSIFLVKVHSVCSETLRYGLLVKDGLPSGVYELLEKCMEPLNLENVPEIEEFHNQQPSIVDSSALLMADLISTWHTGDNSDIKGTSDRLRFSMKPPLVPQLPAESQPASKRYTISPQNEKNPLDFVRSRYFNTLYSLTTPLSYFPKTALSRFKNMCDSDPQQIMECLAQVHLSPEELNRRRSAKYGLFKKPLDIVNPPVLLTRFEAENQALFVSKLFLEPSTDQKDDRTEHLVLEVKIREAQLQILLLLEILICMSIDEEDFLNVPMNNQENSIRKKRKPSLIRRKRKTVIPTFLGVGVDEEETPQKSSETDKAKNHLSLTGLHTSLMTLIDQIALWDSLVERRKADSDQNTHGFLAFVVVPYFSKTLPKTVLLIIRLFKNLNPKLLKPKLSKSKRKLSKNLLSNTSSQSHGENQDGGSTMSSPLFLKWTRSLPSLENPVSDPISDPKSERKLKFSKTLMSPEQIPVLHRAFTSSGLKENRPAFSLKRSKSSLGAKNLKKRQVDIMAAPKNTQHETDARKLSQYTTKLFVFADARKKKSASNYSLTTGADMNVSSSVCQVEATPAKRLSATEVPQVFATPSNKRTVISDFVVKKTPHIPHYEKTSVHYKLKQAAKTASSQHNMAINSSPVHGSEPPDLFLNDLLVSCIQSSSPLMAITSSPATFKSKPGQQISLMQSPFYNNPLTDSRPSTKAVDSRRLQLVRKKGVVKTAKEVVKKRAVKAKPRKVSGGKEHPVPAQENNAAPEIATENGASTEEPPEFASVNALPMEEPPSMASIVDLHILPPAGSMLSILGSVVNQEQILQAQSDSDSDYERLLASLQKPATKKYNKKRIA